MTRRGWLLFALMSVIWGVPYLLIKVAVEDGVSVPVLVFVRTAVGAAILLPLALRGLRAARLRRHWRPLAAFAALEIIVPWWLLADAERQISSSMTGLLIAASPIIAVLVGRLAGGGERLGGARWTGLAVGLAGVTVLAAPGLRGGDVRSIVEVLLAATCYSIAPLILARRLADVPALPMTTVCLGLAAVLYAVPAALTWPQTVPGGPALASLAGLAVLCTALAFLVFFALIREAGPARALVFTYVNPAVAVVAGVVLLDEPLTVAVVVAFTLILAGAVLATGRAKATPEGSSVGTPDESSVGSSANGDRVGAGAVNGASSGRGR
ncbi:DMT family transporter [Plantactinospora sp. B5E13]|uniref:DMT family transporter n=1 Tax=Plantactinospora sp. B5E13 TaxID=3153758 RepID=UPI00325F84CF